MSHSQWNAFYDRSPFLEGVTSTFDLTGQNSSFHSLFENLNHIEYANKIIKDSFTQVGNNLLQAMKTFNNDTFQRFK